MGEPRLWPWGWEAARCPDGRTSWDCFCLASDVGKMSPADWRDGPGVGGGGQSRGLGLSTGCEVRAPGGWRGHVGFLHPLSAFRGQVWKGTWGWTFTKEYGCVPEGYWYWVSGAQSWTKSAFGGCKRQYHDWVIGGPGWEKGTWGHSTHSKLGREEKVNRWPSLPFFFFWPSGRVCGISVPLAGIEPGVLTTAQPGNSQVAALEALSSFPCPALPWAHFLFWLLAHTHALCFFLK